MNKFGIIIALILSSPALAQDSFDVRFLELVNAHRAKNGLAPVKYSAILDSGAQFQANYMDRKRECTHSQWPDSVQPISYPNAFSRCLKFEPALRSKFDFFRENVGGGINIKNAKVDARLLRINGKPLTIDLESVDYWFRRWVKSPPHNDALLDPKVTHAAFGIAGGFRDNFRSFGDFACCVLAVAQ